jgi:hypothetical protein
MPNDQEALIAAIVGVLADTEIRVAALESAYLKPIPRNLDGLARNLAGCQKTARAGKKKIQARLLQEIQISLGNIPPEKTT